MVTYRYHGYVELLENALRASWFNIWRKIIYVKHDSYLFLIKLKPLVDSVVFPQQTGYSAVFLSWWDGQSEPCHWCGWLCSLLPPVVTVGRCRCLGSTSCAYWAENSWMSNTGSVQQEPELGLLETAFRAFTCSLVMSLYACHNIRTISLLFASAHHFINVFPAAIISFPPLKACHCFFH